MVKPLLPLWFITLIFLAPANRVSAIVYEDALTAYEYYPMRVSIKFEYEPAKADVLETLKYGS
jgi:hypothetical protein